MPAKKQQTAEKKVTKAAFLKAMNKDKTAAKAAAKTERKGFLDDGALADKLGLKAGDRLTTAAKVSNIRFYFAKNDTARPAFRFAYVCVSDDKHINGTTVSNNIILEEVDTPKFQKSKEEAYEDLFGEFQGLGEDTKSWDNPLEEAVEAAEYHTKEKTNISVTLNCYAKAAGGVGIGVTPNPARMTDDSDLEEEEEEEEYEDVEEEEEEAPKKTRGRAKKKKGGELVDKWVTWTDDEGSLDFFAESYDEEEESYTGQDEEGEEYTAPASECELAEEQGE